jgi:large subunit ribosomal protein L23
MQVQIKQFLERVYGLRVASVQTVNYDGKKKRRKTGFFKRPDYKKVRTAWQTRQTRDRAPLSRAPGSARSVHACSAMLGQWKQMACAGCAGVHNPGGPRGPGTGEQRVVAPSVGSRNAMHSSSCSGNT